MLLASVAHAAPVPSAPGGSTPTKHKWRVKGMPAPAADRQAKEAPLPAVKQAVARVPQPASSRSSRARLRDAVMQVSAVEEPAAAAPESESDVPLTAQLEPTEPGTAPPAEPSTTETAPAETEPLPPATDPFANEPIPTPPSDSTAPSDTTLPPADTIPAQEKLPPSDLSEGISTTSPASCSDYQSECMRAIRELQRRDITTIPVGLLIEGVEGEDFPCDCRLGGNVAAPQFAGRNWSRTNFAWKATGTCHKPLYFEDVQLERYGHSWNPVLQPFMSAGHFFGSVALLPYHMGIHPPGECQYTLGYYRPGDCAPYMIEPFPISLRGAAFEAAAVTGFYFWLYP
jgi:hypothetical protein